MEKIPVAILGATGAVGQRLALLLENHPYFEVKELFGSSKSAGTLYGNIRWLQSASIPAGLQKMEIKALDDGVQSPLCFSALDAAIADTVEMDLANRGHWVVTNTKSHRMNPDVPLIVPEINWPSWKHAKNRWEKGGILANPNCCAIGLALAVFPLYERFGLDALHVVTLQALSGAGYPGVASLDIFDNVIPHIQEEIEKIEEEIPKIFGVEGKNAFAVSAQVNRVAVLDGHTLVINLKLGSSNLSQDPKKEDLEKAYRDFSSNLPWKSLPSSPKDLYYLEKDPLAPQPRLHRDRGGGMSITIGPMRPCSILDWKFTALVHNTLRGAAGGALLIAEALYREGVFLNKNDTKLKEGKIDPEHSLIAKSTCSGS